ncbi:FadR/GntR family transcriptional regulator [Bacillus massiliigorillae]|uniref:FadR/GntR family transcriptional regulator n=1 Tax=Bacillus massiliigorillae TaxID=1243664 RepID=UPI0003A9A7FB|nr:FadR/GntR family transcriptional regulator [Bacillus massiliigorillae]
MIPPPKQNQKVYQIIFHRIKESIVAGEFIPGDKLPSERDLAIRFNVSRTSIREALRALEIHGIIESKQGDGTFIKASDLQKVIDDLSTAIMHPDDYLVYEMLETRQALESECAYLAAYRANSYDLEKMRKCIEDMRIASGDEEKGLMADLNFHYSIAEAAHNSILLGLVQILGEHMKNTIRITRNYRFSNTTYFQETFSEHRELYLAIANRDADSAKKLMENHITKTRQKMTEATIKDVE